MGEPERPEPGVGRGPAAIETLVRDHAGAAWNLARSLVRDDAAAEEAVNEAFADVQRLSDALVAAADPRTVVLAACYRRCAERLSREPSLADTRADRLRLPPLGHPDLRSEMDRAVGALRPDDRDAFVLAEVAGYDRATGAAVVGASLSMFSSRLDAAREKVARALAEARQKATGE